MKVHFKIFTKYWYEKIYLFGKIMKPNFKSAEYRKIWVILKAEIIGAYSVKINYNRHYN